MKNLKQIYDTVICNLQRNDSNATWHEILTENNNNYICSLKVLKESLIATIDMYKEEYDDEVDTIAFYESQLDMLK